MPDCPGCGTPLAPHGEGDLRCPACNGKSATAGIYSHCQMCSSLFAVGEWKAKAYKKKPTFCSLNCSYEWRRGKPSTTARPDEKQYHAGGYVLIYMPEHPDAHKGRVLEHRVVAEKKYGRRLTPEDHVHHLDGDKTNNHPDNLVVLTNSEHQRQHTDLHQRLRDRVEITCGECGTKFEKKRCRTTAVDPRNISRYCSIECRRKAQGKKMKEYWARMRAA